MEPERVLLASTPTAVVRAELAPSEIGSRIISLYDAVYASLAAAGAVQDGQNIAIYRPVGDGRVAMEAGVQVAAPFVDRGELICSEIPGGAALHVHHDGPYRAIPAAFDAVFAWAAENGVQTNGVTVEIYGDPHEDGSDGPTDLYALLGA